MSHGEAAVKTRAAHETVARSDARELNPAVAVLRRVALFADIDDTSLFKLAAEAATAHRYRKGEHILKVGDPGDTLLVIAEGVVEIVLERFGGQVSLRQLRDGEYFGELSLFDGQPRSASALAVTDCEIYELARERVLDALGASPVTRTLMTELAVRVRHTDSTVCDLAEKISRSANANAHAAVSVELDTIKLLYQRTEHRTSQLLAQTERSAAEAVERANTTLARANEVTSSVEREVRTALAVIKKRVVPVMSAIVLIFTAIGVGSFWDLTSKYKEAKAMHGAMQGWESHMRSAARGLDIVRETMINVRNAREATRLNQPIETPADLRRVALSYEVAKNELAERFLVANGDVHRYDAYEPEVVFDALDTWVTLALRDRLDGKLVTSPHTRRQLVRALTNVVRRLGQFDGGASVTGSSWLLDVKLRDLAYLLGEGADVDTRYLLLSDLDDIAARGPSERSRDNAALILASFGRSNDAARERLAAMQHSDRPWRAAVGAIALAKLDDEDAYRTIVERLQQTDAIAYPFASSLAQYGGAAVKALISRYEKKRRARAATLGLIRSALERHEPRNCFEERYKRWLGACLDNRCGRASPTEPIGGKCRLGEEKEQNGQNEN